MYSEDELARLDRIGWLQGWEFLPQTPSTNTHALNHCASRPAPYLVLAQAQTAGRGRGANVWWSQPGGLMFSLILEAGQSAPPTRAWPRLSLAVGLAVARAVEPLGRPQPLQLKWPNDVYLGGKKLCGILLEAAGGNRQIVVGLGLNVNNSFRHAPPEQQRIATSLLDETGRQHELFDVLEAVLQQINRHVSELAAESLALRQRWAEHCRLTGRQIVVNQPKGEPVAGRCLGIDDDGALLVETSSGVTPCVAGTVEELPGEEPPGAYS